MEQAFDIFNLDNEDFLKPEVSSNGDQFLYKPYPELGKDGVYKSLIRFVPNVANPKKSKIHKYYVWLKDPIDSTNFVADCPTTVGKKSILKDIYWKLYNSTSAKDKELSKNFSRKEDFYSLIQIVKDPNRPDLEGKIMIFKFGKKVNDLIEQEIKPEFGAPGKPFDVFEGKNFGLHVRKVGEWNNYDLCQFVGDRTPMLIGNKPVQKTAESQKEVVEYLKQGPQDLVEKYDYKEWSDEDRETIIKIIRNTVPDGRLVSSIVGGSSDTKTTSSASSNYESPIKKSAADDFLDEVSSEIDDKEDYKPAKTTSKNSAADSSLDDLYNNL